MGSKLQDLAVYTGAVRPVLEYASSSWNLGLRTILGAMKITPIAEMEKTANIQPLENRRQEKLLIQGETLNDS